MTYQPILDSSSQHGRGAERAPRPILAMKAGAVVLIGLLLGIAAGAGDRGMGLHTSDIARVVFWLPNIGSVWIAVAFFAGAWFGRPLTSIAAGCASLVSAVTAYYTFGLTLGDRAHLGLAAIGPTLVFWLVAALVGGPMFGLLGFAYRHGQKGIGFLGALALPAVIVAESGNQLLRELPYLGNDPWRDGLLLVMLGIGVILAVLFFRRWRVRMVGPLA
jgi:Family of unknown function (DUF6518)